jgi:hypothetical protein
MTKHEAAIVSAFTGYMLCTFDDLHAYAQKLLGREVEGPEFANPPFVAKLKEAARKDFDNLEIV